VSNQIAQTGHLLTAGVVVTWVTSRPVTSSSATVLIAVSPKVLSIRDGNPSADSRACKCFILWVVCRNGGQPG
jgi:hypothetical protein